MRILLACLLTTTLLGCATPGPERTVCTDLAWIFYAVASYRDEGKPVADQHAWARAEFDDPRSRDVAIRIIDYVHTLDARDALPMDVGQLVRDGCNVAPDGSAVLTLARRETR